MGTSPAHATWGLLTSSWIMYPSHLHPQTPVSPTLLSTSLLYYLLSLTTLWNDTTMYIVLCRPKCLYIRNLTLPPHQHQRSLLGFICCRSADWNDGSIGSYPRLHRWYMYLCTYVQIIYDICSEMSLKPGPGFHTQNWALCPCILPLSAVPIFSCPHRITTVLHCACYAGCTLFFPQLQQYCPLVDAQACVSASNPPHASLCNFSFLLCAPDPPLGSDVDYMVSRLLTCDSLLQEELCLTHLCYLRF